MCFKKTGISAQIPAIEVPFSTVLNLSTPISKEATPMTSKTSLAALALSAAILAIPTGANAGFVGHDRYWTGVDARMQRLWSFKWLCRDEPVVAKQAKAKVRKPAPAPTK